MAKRLCFANSQDKAAPMMAMQENSKILKDTNMVRTASLLKKATAKQVTFSNTPIRGRTSTKEGTTYYKNELGKNRAGE